MRETMQHVAVKSSVPFKKRLPCLIYARNKQQRNIPVFYFTQVIIPVFIFYPKHYIGLQQVQQFFCMGSTIHWQVKNLFKIFIIFCNFITRRRKESNSY